MTPISLETGERGPDGEYLYVEVVPAEGSATDAEVLGALAKKAGVSVDRLRLVMDIAGKIGLARIRELSDAQLESEVEAEVKRFQANGYGGKVTGLLAAFPFGRGPRVRLLTTDEVGPERRSFEAHGPLLELLQSIAQLYVVKVR